MATDPEDDERLAVRGDGHPVIAGHWNVIHIPLDVGAVGVAEGGHGVHVFPYGCGVGPDDRISLQFWGKWGNKD